MPSQSNRFARLRSTDLPVRTVEVLLLIAIIALATWWALRILTGPPLPVAPSIDLAANANAGPPPDALLDSAQLFGSRRPGALSDNIQAIGLIADARGKGAVLLSVDGQPAKRYRVGEEVDGRRIVAIRPGEVELDSQGTRRVYRMSLPELQTTGIVRR